MTLPITEKFKAFEKKILESKNIEDASFSFKFLESEDDISLDDIIRFLTKRLTQKGYKNVEERYIDILNIDTSYFHASLEVDDYGSQVEFNISKVFTGLSLLDFDDKLWYEGQSQEEIALWKTFRVFDTRPEIGDGKMSVFSIQEGISPPSEPAIYYIDRAETHKTNLTFVQYYEAVLDMIGIADWQLLFTDVSWNDPLKKSTYDELKAALQALVKTFPEKEYSRYFELLESKWDN